MRMVPRCLFLLVSLVLTFPLAAQTELVLVPFGSVWRYLDKRFGPGHYLGQRRF